MHFYYLLITKIVHWLLFGKKVLFGKNNTNWKKVTIVMERSNRYGLKGVILLNFTKNRTADAMLPDNIHYHQCDILAQSV